MGRVRKTATDRAEEFPNRSILKKKKIMVVLDDEKKKSLLEFWVKWMAENQKEPSDSLYVTLARILTNNDYIDDLFDMYQRCINSPRHSLENFILLWGIEDGTEKYNKRRKNLSSKMKLSSKHKVDAFLNKRDVKKILYDIEITPDIKSELNSLLNSRDYSEFHDNLYIICDMIKYYESGFVNRYDTIKNSSIHDIEYFKARYSDHWIEKYNEWRERMVKQSHQVFKSTIEYWTSKGYSVYEAKDMVRKFQSESSNKRNYENLISARSKEYWLSKGLLPWEVDVRVKEIQSRDVDFYTSKGIDEQKANSIVENRIKKSQESFNTRPKHERDSINQSKGRTYKQLVEEHGIEKANVIIKNRMSQFRGVSKESNDFFKSLDGSLPNELRNQSITDYKGKEHWIRTEESKFYFLDYKLGNCVIEYYGSFWHCDPEDFLGKHWHPVQNRFAADIWHDDENKIKDIEKLGYHVKVIWSNEVNRNYKKAIEDCKRFINDHYRKL